ncbi:MAG: hypothetical protein VX988_09075 [Planctomycetota bacterium]|nr:hypothetical protein [Planctomycetota bacterium]
MNSIARRNRRVHKHLQKLRRSAAATLDYVLVLCVVFPLAAFLLYAGPRIIMLVYEMMAVMISWPFT